MAVTKTLAEKEKAACPEVHKHTDEPDGYLQWHAWAEKKSKTHHQIKCPGCGYYVIWVRT